jgi:ribosomal protein S18 acetylase RimI-like enzyme
VIDKLEFLTNRADINQIALHLWACDKCFVPPLSRRLMIDDYACKLVERSIRFEAWQNDELIGLVAAYCNDPDKQVAFITNVSVLGQWQFKGIATRLVKSCIEYAKELQFMRMELEVDIKNSGAAKFYKKMNFNVDRVTGVVAIMFLNIWEEA